MGSQTSQRHPIHTECYALHLILLAAGIVVVVWYHLLVLPHAPCRFRCISLTYNEFQKSTHQAKSGSQKIHTWAWPRDHLKWVSFTYNLCKCGAVMYQYRRSMQHHPSNSYYSGMLILQVDSILTSKISAFSVQCSHCASHKFLERKEIKRAAEYWD